MAKVSRSAAFPKLIFITRDENAGDDENLLAWGTLDSADAGKVAVYRLEEEIEKREAVEIRRKGTGKWFKP